MIPAQHIVLLTPGFPESETDYLCVPPVQGLLKGLQAKHPELTITAVALQYPYKRREYHWHNIPVFACGGNNRKFPGRLMVWRQALKTLERLHEAAPISCIHALWASEATLLAQRMNRRHGIPVLCTLMGQDARPANTYLKRLNFDNLTTVALSDNQSNTFTETTGRQPNALVPWAIDPAELPKPAAERDVDVLGVGSLIDLKRYDLFLEVVAALKEQRPNIRAVLLGDGPNRAALEQQAKALGLEDNIEFTGLLPRPVVLQWMGRSKVLLHPSEYESFGFVFAEAQAMGCNIVSCETGWNEPGAHWNIAERERNALAASTAELLNESPAPKQLVTERFNRLLNEYTQLYRQ